MKWSIQKVTLVILAIMFASGCAIFAQPVAEKVAGAVEKYCQEPLGYRTIYRNTINAQLTQSGHIVHVHCAGDPTNEPE